MENLSVSAKDAKIISQVVELFGPEEGVSESSCYQKLKMHILRIFGQDITIDHYIMLGQVIGLKSFTDKKKREKINLLNYDCSN